LSGSGQFLGPLRIDPVDFHARWLSQQSPPAPQVVLHLGIASDPGLVTVVSVLVNVLDHLDESIGIGDVPQQPDVNPTRPFVERDRLT
jgi:hypothetical protein